MWQMYTAFPRSGSIFPLIRVASSDSGHCMMTRAHRSALRAWFFSRAVHINIILCTSITWTAPFLISESAGLPILILIGDQTPGVTASNVVALVIPDNEQAILLIPDHFPSLFLVCNTYVCIYNDYKHLFSLFHLYLP